MASCGYGAYVMTLLLLAASLACTIVGIVTDYWYNVERDGLVTEAERREGTYHFGFWRRCYDDSPPSLSPGQECVTIFRDNLFPSSESNMTSDEKLVMNLSRSYIGLALLSGAAQLAVIITLICGTFPGDCKHIRKFALYASAAVILTLALLSSVASGVCFLAAREVEDDELHLYQNLDTDFGWSFMLHWIGAGLMLIDGVILLCLMRYAHEDVGDWQKNFYDL